MRRLWSLLPATQRSRRGRGIAVLALAVLVPVILLVTLLPHRGADDVPAALVNLDVPVAGTEGNTPVAAGKLLTENLLTTPGGFSWTLTDPATAKAGIEDGRFLAVVTVPADFSHDAATLAGSAPTQASLAVQTSAAHGYLVSAVAEALTTSLPTGVSAELTSGYVDGTLSAFGTLHTGLGEAATAASDIALATSQAAGGAEQLRGATGELVGGLREVAEVLAALPPGARGLGDLTAAGALDAAVLADVLDGQAVTASQALSTQQAADAALTDLIAWVQANPGASAGDVLGRLSALQGQVSTVESQLSGQSQALAAEAVDAAVLAAGAGTIAALSGPVADGLGDLADATAGAAGAADELAAADGTLASGLDQLASGSGELSSSLSQVTAGLPSYSADQQKQIASVVATPITVDRAVGAGPATAELSAVAAVAPLGLWLGAFVLFLVLAPFARSALITSAAAWRIALDGAFVAVAFALLQAGVLWIVLALGGDAPERLGVALAFVAVMAVCFALVHQALIAAFGRAGFLVSAVALGLQLVAAGTIAPPSLAPAAQTPLSLLPLSLGLQGAEALVGGSLHAVLPAIVGMAVWGVAALIATIMVVGASRRRRIRALVTA